MEVKEEYCVCSVCGETYIANMREDLIFNFNYCSSYCGGEATEEVPKFKLIEGE